MAIKEGAGDFGNIISNTCIRLICVVPFKVVLLLKFSPKIMLFVLILQCGTNRGCAVNRGNMVYVQLAGSSEMYL